MSSPAPTKNKRPLQKLWKMQSLHMAQWLMQYLPRWLITLILLPSFFIAFFFMGKLKKIAHINLQSVYGENDKEKNYSRMIKKSFFHIGHCMIDLLHFVDRPQKLMQHVQIHGEEHLKAALEQKRGVVAFSAHLNNFPLLFVALVQKGYPINVIIRTMRDVDFSLFMFNLCAKWNIHMIPTKPQKTLLRQSYKAIQNNEILFILSDEVAPENTGVSVPFFDHHVRRATGPLLYHKKFQSPILPIFICQDHNKKFHIHIEPEIKLVDKETSPDSDTQNIAHINTIIERYVRQYPTQWGGWFNKRWSSLSTETIMKN